MLMMKVHKFSFPVYSRWITWNVSLCKELCAKRLALLIINYVHINYVNWIWKIDVCSTTRQQNERCPSQSWEDPGASQRIWQKSEITLEAQVIRHVIREHYYNIQKLKCISTDIILIILLLISFTYCIWLVWLIVEKKEYPGNQKH